MSPDRHPDETTALLVAQLEREINRPVSYVTRAAEASWYPIQGIWFWIRHREFWPLFSARIIPLAIISILTYGLLFATIFIPQYLILAIWLGWSAWFNAVVLVLGEGLVVIQGVYEGFFVDRYRADVFDAALIELGMIDLIAPHRELFLDAPNSVKMLGKPKGVTEYQPFSFIQIFELIVYLPLNLIPIVGPFSYIMITGSRLGKLSLYRWYKLRGVSKHDMKKDWKNRAWEYLWFGSVCQLMEMIPVLSFFLLMTSTVGSAIWAVKMEKKLRQQVEEGRAGHHQGSNYESEDCLYNDPV